MCFKQAFFRIPVERSGARFTPFGCCPICVYVCVCLPILSASRVCANIVLFVSQDDVLTHQLLHIVRRYTQNRPCRPPSHLYTWQHAQSPEKSHFSVVIQCATARTHLNHQYSPKQKNSRMILYLGSSHSNRIHLILRFFSIFLGLRSFRIVSMQRVVRLLYENSNYRVF